MSPKLDSICVEGGGVKGVAYTGWVYALEERGLMPYIKTSAGSSAGALSCVFVSVGYSARAIEEIMLFLDFNQFKFTNGFFNKLWRIYKKGAIYDGSKLEEWVDRIIYEKTGIKNMTFKDLYKFCGFNLILTATCVELSRTIYFNYRQFPNQKISQICRASMTIPGFWDPVVLKLNLEGETKKYHFVDGGMLDNYPIHLFEDKLNRVIGFKLISIDEEYDEKEEKIVFTKPKLDNGIDFAIQYIKIYMNAMENKHVNSKYWDRTVPIPTKDISAIDFDIDEKIKTDLINEAYKATNNWLDKNGY